jgi:pimeloyl-ACP methyl ester carboxylesterase
VAVLTVLFIVTAPALAQRRWETLPPTPTLPAPDATGMAPVNGIRMFYATYGHGEPVVMIHGGLANSAYWGLQIPVLARQYQVLVLDSRGHGRSTRTPEPISYELMASDVLALLDFLKVRRTSLIGWSDGAIIGLRIAIHHPERLERLFAFAGNSDPSGTKKAIGSPAFAAYGRRVEQEYKALSPTPDGFNAFRADLSRMWASQPRFTARQLQGITVPTWIVDGDHDEIIKRQDTAWMASQIPGSTELILPGVGHFAFLQDPAAFNEAVLRFLTTPR